jgi:hypothetical protein
VLDFQNFGPVGSKRLAHQATRFGQHFVEIVGTQGEVAEVRQDPGAS